jgi:hypothetical protein
MKKKLLALMLVLVLSLSSAVFVFASDNPDAYKVKPTTGKSNPQIVRPNSDNPDAY